MTKAYRFVLLSYATKLTRLHGLGLGLTLVVFGLGLITVFFGLGLGLGLELSGLILALVSLCSGLANKPG